MDQVKKLAEIANQVTPIEETQQGQLSGGFASFSSAVSAVGEPINNNININNVSSCSCSCDKKQTMN